ncbi:MAG: hypothetical protein EAZ48_03255 [Flavobacteriia bacterium]|nr:MAG: hypothetical protein EAZ48_03255 [Flavobacteriia bacterium]
MEQFQLEYIGAREDSKKSLIYTSVWLLSMLLLAFIIKFDARPDQLVDTPPLRSDEVIEEFQIDNVELEEVSGGSRGGGTPGSGRIAPPADQTERVATSSQSDFSHNNGNSNNHNSQNGTNTSSTTTQRTNHFNGNGGSGNGNGSGNGPFGGNGNGSGEGDDGIGSGRGSGKGRVRLNSVSLPSYESDFDCRIGFMVQVNSEGQVINVRSVRSITTCADDRIISDIKERIKREVKYNKSPGAVVVEMNYTIDLKARN